MRQRRTTPYSSVLYPLAVAGSPRSRGAQNVMERGCVRASTNGSGDGALSARASPHARRRRQLAEVAREVGRVLRRAAPAADRRRQAALVEKRARPGLANGHGEVRAGLAGVRPRAPDAAVRRVGVRHDRQRLDRLARPVLRDGHRAPLRELALVEEREQVVAQRLVALVVREVADLVRVLPGVVELVLLGVAELAAGEPAVLHRDVARELVAPLVERADVRARRRLVARAGDRELVDAVEDVVARAGALGALERRHEADPAQPRPARDRVALAGDLQQRGHQVDLLAEGLRARAGAEALLVDDRER